jgi:hypothetical protein
LRGAIHSFQREELRPVSDEKKVWFITGAGRGMGVDIAKAALAAGNAVVARPKHGHGGGSVRRG